MDRRIYRQLEPLARRYRRWKMWSLLACLWMFVIMGTGFALMANVQWGWYSPWAAMAIASAAGGLAIILCIATASSYRNYKWIAQEIERQYPDLDSTLLTAVDIQCNGATEPTGQFAHYGFLESQVLHGVLSHAYKNRWDKALPTKRLVAAHLAHWSSLIAAVVVLCCLSLYAKAPSTEVAKSVKKKQKATGKTEVSVEPGNKEIERNSSLVVLARFTGRQPDDVTLVCRDSKGEETEYSMTRSMDDPIYAYQLSRVSREFDYFIRFAGEQSSEYRIDVFENPSLVQADAHLKYPKFANEPDKLVEDFRHVSAVEGTNVTVKCKLNKSVAKARLVDDDGNEHPLKVVAEKGGDVYQLSWLVRETKRFVLHLEDSEGRRNSEPPKLVVRATPNRRPTVKLKSPRDVQVSPLEEYLVQATFWDDFGVKRYGVTLNFNGEQKDIVLGKDQPKSAKPEGQHLLDFESLKAKPDQLLTYHFWAEDFGADGKARRTHSDMFFAEVRPFEEIFRQGQQPAGGQRQQQRQNRSGQRGQQGQGARLAQLQKQIITATWNIIRRYDDQPLDDKFKSDAKVIGDSQIQALQQAAAAGQRIQDLKAKEHLAEAIKQMKQAAELLTEAYTQGDQEKLRPALRHEQSAYRSLLHLRNREHRVIRQQQRRNQQRQGSPNGGQRNNRQQRQLQQLKLKNDQNRYETQRTAQQQQQNNATQQKNRELLNRLKELTRRQEDLNKQIQDLQSALQAARTEKEREELRKQLKRLRDEQKNIMRDTDKVANRMDQSTDPQQAAEAQRRLDKTRQDQRRAADSLEKGKLSQAAAAGSRAEKDLKKLRDDIRRKSANQFAEEVKNIRKKAGDIQKRQQDIRDQLAGGKDQQKKSLRSKDGRESTSDKLQKQSKDLGNLLRQMKDVIEKSETAEPLLSDRLYDAWRKGTQDKLADNANTTRQLLDRGFIEQANKAEKPLNEGIKRLNKGIRRAARTVLGDETQALKQAKSEVDQLRKELQNESDRAQGRTPGQRDDKKSGKQRDGKASSKQSGKQSGKQRDGKASGKQPGKQGGKQSGKQRSADGKQGGKAGAKQRGSKQTARGGKQSGKQRGGKQSGKQRGGKQRGGKQAGGKQAGNRRGNQQRSGVRRGGNPNADPNRLGGLADLFNNDTRPRAPLQGGDYRQWSNRLRDVEEMLENPDLRRQAIKIREKMRELRRDVKRHSKTPNWDLVQKNILGPLNELQKRIQEEILRKEPEQKLVPLDRDPVPKGYEDKVKEYFRRLGGGK